MSRFDHLENDAKTALETARELAADLGKLGAGWIRYGITVGESSIQASARSLDEVARALRKVADRMRKA